MAFPLLSVVLSPYGSMITLSAAYRRNFMQAAIHGHGVPSTALAAPRDDAARARIMTQPPVDRSSLPPPRAARAA